MTLVTHLASICDKKLYHIGYKTAKLILFCTLSGIILAGCTSLNQANRKLKRANRLIAQAEQLGVKWHSDTVFQKIPVYIDSVRVDSIFTSRQGDTVYLEKERLKIKYVRLPGDSVYIDGKCDSLTKIVDVPISVTKEIKTGLGVLTVVQWSVLALIIGLVAGAVIVWIRKG
jgi:hypothetical protein